ncbi:Pro-resilin [Zootermopsis nevadensis]|uniref:Pro-resilin n=2 Tax=Zootermopsis nevadensis TaxID=136037 RepID=A0A067QU30_ZOONE|nr:Pro-resilin [Zootermopsis nevadensis]
MLGVFATAGVVNSAPQTGPANTYLPPDQGYQYNRPSVPFPSPVPVPGPSGPPPSFHRPSPGTFRPSPTPTYGPPQTGPQGPPRPPPTFGGGQNLGDEHLHDHHVPGMPYDFNYAVKDDYYGTDYSHNAISDGDVVKGEYRVLLPDGRLQIVRYTADWKTGFHADVSYEGQASYPDTNRPAYNYPGPSSSIGGSGPSATYGPPGTSSPGY